MEADKFTQDRAFLEKAFKRCQTGLRSSKRGCKIFAARGKVESDYVDELNRWVEESNKIIQDKDFDGCKEIVELYQAIVNETSQRAKLHKDFSLALIDRESSSQILTSIDETRESRLHTQIDVNKMEKEFKWVKNQLRSLENCSNEWIRTRDKYSNDIERLRDGNRKRGQTVLDNIRSLDDELASLERKLENAKKKLESVNKKCGDFKEKQLNELFPTMKANLDKVEGDRVSETLNAFNRHYTILITSEKDLWRRSLRGCIQTFRSSLGTVHRETILTAWRRKTMENVSESLKQKKPSLMVLLFNRESPTIPFRDEFGSDIGQRPFSKDITDIRNCESLAARRRESEHSSWSSLSQTQSFLDELERGGSLMNAFFSPSSSTESLVPVKESKFSGKSRVKTVKVHPAEKELAANGSISDVDDSMENIPILPSTNIGSPPRSPVNFCATDSEDEDAEAPVLSKAPANFHLVNQLLSLSDDVNGGACDKNKGHDVSNLVNVRVRANRTFKSTNDEMLSFNAGQVIKQKRPRDERGYSFGWTRAGRLSLKRYGFYPSEYVSFQ